MCKNKHDKKNKRKIPSTAECNYAITRTKTLHILYYYAQINKIKIMLYISAEIAVAFIHFNKQWYLNRLAIHAPLSKQLLKTTQAVS